MLVILSALIDGLVIVKLATSYCLPLRMKLLNYFLFYFLYFSQLLLTHWMIHLKNSLRQRAVNN